MKNIRFPQIIKLFGVVLVCNIIGMLAVDSVASYVTDIYSDFDEDSLAVEESVIEEMILSHSSNDWWLLADQIMAEHDVYAEVVIAGDYPTDSAVTPEELQALEEGDYAYIEDDAYTFIDQDMPLIDGIDKATYLFDLDDENILLIEVPLASWESNETLSWLYGVVAMLITFLLMYRTIVHQHRSVNALNAKLVNSFGANGGEQAHDVDSAISQLEQHLNQKQREQLLTVTDQRELFHAVAHEFRSPMAKMQFALDLINEETEAGRVKLVGKINKYLNDLDHLVKELLFYSQVSFDATEPHFNRVNLHQVTENVIETVSVFYPEIQFVNNVDDITIKSQENLVERLLLNLARNAGRFATKVCEISAYTAQTAAYVCVEDDGPGIPTDKLKAIFVPFTRLDSSRSRDSGGCGLGLAIVASIAKRHGADVTVTTGKLGGAKFLISFPLPDKETN